MLSPAKTNSSLIIAAPVIVLRCMAIGSAIGGIRAYCVQHTVVQSVDEQLLSCLEEGDQLASPSATVVDRFNIDSSSPVSTPTAMYSAARTKRKLKPVYLH
jgi:hypothetical protein